MATIRSVSRLPPAEFPVVPSAPIVTVVVPAWNASKYLREAIQSVLNQTFTRLELVVVDDGSTDDTAAIVRAFADRRLTLVTQQNGGPGRARNRGISESAPSTRYFAFLDADDSWAPEKLSRQIDQIEHEPRCGAVVTFARYVSSTGRALGRGGEPLTPALNENIARADYYPAAAMSSLLVRRSVMERVGAFDEALGRLGSEDLDFIARLAQVAPIGAVPEPLISYRVHPDSTMARERHRVNRAARFVQRRCAARRAGLDLSWTEFVATDRVSWADRRQDAVERCYRNAALWFGEQHGLRAAAYGLLAVAIDPRYTLRRVYRQRFGSSQTIQEAMP
jgi:glycosyltransferase involved in cell wall biosynthesis